MPRLLFRVLLAVGVVGIGVFAYGWPTVRGAVAVLSLMAFASMAAFLPSRLWSFGFLAEPLVNPPITIGSAACHISSVCSEPGCLLGLPLGLEQLLLCTGHKSNYVVGHSTDATQSYRPAAVGDRPVAITCAM